MSDMLKLILPLAILQLILVVAAFIDLSKVRRTNGPKWMWAIVILFSSLLGSVAYFLFGRRSD
ncbi:PLD nuclease N-terminal domain-containing protein [Paenibacillus sp. D51F]